MTGQSKTSGQKAVEEALRLRKAWDSIRESIKERKSVLISADSEPYELAEVQLELPDLREKLITAQKSLSLKEHALGVEGKKNYAKLASSPFITDLMNAQALKIRLRQRLQAQKFERDCLERTFRRQINSEL